MERNLLLSNPVGIVFGQRGGPEVTGRLHGNVVLDGRDINERTRRGTGLWLTEIRNVEVSENVVAHQRSGSGTVVGINIDGTYADVQLRGNVVYDWTLRSGGRGVALAWHGTPDGPVHVEDNHFQQVRGGYLVGHYAPLSEGFVYTDNTYFSKGDEFWRDTTFEQWQRRSGEHEEAYRRQEFPEATRTLEGYMKAIGAEGGLEEFLKQARAQSRANWQEAFTAQAVIEFVRAGFEITSE